MEHLYLVEKLAAFYGTERFITGFTTTCHWFLSSVTWIQPITFI